MRALVHDGREVRVEEALPCPAREPGEVRIRVTLAGICNTDLEITRGYMSFRGVLGHEFVGVVDAADDLRLLGRRVVGEINCSCHECPTCRAGRPRHCPRRTVVGIDRRDGVFADFVTLPQRNVHMVPEGVPDDRAVFCEPLAAVLRMLEQVDLEPPARAAVIGDGKLGLLAGAALAGTLGECTVFGRHRERAGLFEGVDHRTEAPGDHRWAGAFDLVVEASGSACGLNEALDLVRPGGTIVVKTTIARSQPLQLSRIVVDELVLVGSRCGSFEPALELLASGRMPVENLIARRFPLVDGVQALREAATGTLKVLLEIGSRDGGRVGPA